VKLSALKIDPARIEQGTWIDDIPDMPGVELKVRGFGNTDDKRIQAAAYDALPRAKKIRGKLDADDAEKIMNERLLGAILCDWKGLEQDDGQPLQYAPDVAEALITDPAYSRFRQSVIWAAGIVGEEAAADLETDAKN